MNRFFVRYPGFLQKALTLSYDDGVVQDRRLIEILNRHGIKCTFNLNGSDFTPTELTGLSHPRLSRQDALQLYTRGGHEVAVHSYTHPFLEQLPTGNAAWEIIRDREALEEMFGCMVRGMAYPMGTYNDDVVTALQQCGIAYARTVQSTKSFDLPHDWYRWHPTCHHNNPALEQLCQDFLTPKRKQRLCKLFYLWGHSYEFDEQDNWNVIENFCQTMGGREDIWYATNLELRDYIAAARQLRSSVDGTMLHNPTATVLFLETATDRITLAPGQTIRL